MVLLRRIILVTKSPFTSATTLFTEFVTSGPQIGALGVRPPSVGTLVFVGEVVDVASVELLVSVEVD